MIEDLFEDMSKYKFDIKVGDYVKFTGFDLAKMTWSKSMEPFADCKPRKVLEVIKPPKDLENQVAILMLDGIKNTKNRTGACFFPYKAIEKVEIKEKENDGNN